MKKIFLGLLITFISLSSIAQNERPPITGSDFPDGTHPVLTYEFDEFHFHRPKQDCKRGFWFCTVGGQWTVTCVANSAFPYKSVINEKGLVNVIPELGEEEVKFHFPGKHLNSEGNTIEDLSKFSVDEEIELNFGSIKVKLTAGEYPVNEIEDELVVLVPFK